MAVGQIGRVTLGGGPAPGAVAEGQGRLRKSVTSGMGSSALSSDMTSI